MPQLFPNVFNLSALNGVNGFVLNGVTSGDNAGFSVSNAGDVNGDGVNDIILGTRLNKPRALSEPSSAFVVFGQKGYYPAAFELASLDGTQGFRINGVNNGDETGWSVSGAGDVNGDGLDDVLVGAPYAAPHNVTQAGSVFVVFGQRTPFSGALALSDLTGSNGFRINAFTCSQFGTTVSGAGDVNGDGVADVILGCTGHTWVIFGQRLGFPAVFELRQVDGQNGFELQSTETYDNFGSPNSHADVNGDGLSDIIIGASGASPNGRSGAGSAFVIFGSRSPFPANFSMSALNGSNGFRVNGIQPDDYTGSAVGSAGDFNGDGVEDFLLGAPTVLSEPYQEAGSAFLVYGQRTPFPAVLELSDLDGRNGFRVNGMAASDDLGDSLGGGDFNGDGLSDLLLGAAQVPSRQTGMAGVVFGQRAAMVTPLELAALDGSNGFRLYGVTLGDQTGLSVSTAGDFNGDGIDDILIGAPEASPGGRSKSGVAYMMYGDRIQWLNQAFFIHQNETLMLDTHHLNVSVPGHWDHLNFQVEGVTHGQFEYANQRGTAIEGFSYQDISQGQVLFKHDGSDQAPQFGFRASHVLAGSNASAVVTFGYQPPALLNNSIALLQGHSWTLSSSQLGARAYLEGNTPTLQFSILGAEHLQFRDKASHENLNSFSQEAVAAGNVVATHDGSPHAPTYQVAVSDAFNQVGPDAAEVYFTGRPYLTRNHYEIYSQTRLLISNSSLAAYDPSTVLLPLLFKIENVTSGGFVHAQTEKPVAQFTAEDMNRGQIYFQPDNSSVAPRFAVVVSNGVLSSEPKMAEVNYIVPTSAPAASSGSTTALRDGLIAGGVAAAVLGLGLGWMYKRHKERYSQSERSLNLNMRLIGGNTAPIGETEEVARTSSYA